MLEEAIVHFRVKKGDLELRIQIVGPERDSDLMSGIIEKAKRLAECLDLTVLPDPPAGPGLSAELPGQNIGSPEIASPGPSQGQK